MQKGVISKLILEKLSEATEIALEGLFPRNSAEGRMWRRTFGLPEGYEFSKPTFSTMLNYLKKQGLVEKKGRGRLQKWLITKKGKNKIKLYGRFMRPTKSDGIPRLVMYDIPEKERKKRDWLRYELISCDYNQLQRSVWLGYSPLPEEFIQSLKDLNLKDKVQIVSIHKKGTLTEF